MLAQTAVERRRVGARRRPGGVVTELDRQPNELRLVGLAQALVGIDAEAGSQISDASPHCHARLQLAPAPRPAAFEPSCSSGSRSQRSRSRYRLPGLVARTSATPDKTPTNTESSTEVESWPAELGRQSWPGTREYSPARDSPQAGQSRPEQSR